MKKGICIILSTLIAVMSFAACNKEDSEYADATTYTNKDGKAYVMVTDENGKEKTDADGNAETSVLSDEEASKIQEAKSKASKNEEKNSASGDNSSTKGTGKNETTTGSFSDLADSDMEMTAAAEDLLPEGTTVKSTTEKRLYETVILSTIKSKKFTLQFNMVSGDDKIPATIAFNGENLCADVSYSGWKIRMLTLDSKMYFIFPALNIYMEWDESGDIFDGLDDISSEQKYVKTTKVNDYTCEEYSADGATTKYYFDSNNNWKRWESIDEDGTAIVYEISSFSSSVDSSLFSLKGFTKVDADKLASLLS